MKLRFKFRKKQFLSAFCIIVIILSLVKCIFPSVANMVVEKGGEARENVAVFVPDSIDAQRDATDSILLRPRATCQFVDSAGNRLKKHKIFSVQSFKNTFPDLNDVQLATAERLGVKPVKNRVNAEQRKAELVYVGSSPFFYVETLKHSAPYLVPRAYNLLTHIGRTFLDSLEIKHIPFNTIIVTSVLRTEDDVVELRKHNGNASEQSCHRFGTTFDICYNRYRNVYDPEAKEPRQVRNDTLKWILSEVLNDCRRAGLCYIKYEVKQGCFHITTR